MCEYVLSNGSLALTASSGVQVANGFVELVKGRNQMARLLGFVDFYDYKVTAAEGFGKDRLFEILDGLEGATRSIMDSARALLAKEKGAEALKPWNTSFLMCVWRVVRVRGVNGARQVRGYHCKAGPLLPIREGCRAMGPEFPCTRHHLPVRVYQS